MIRNSLHRKPRCRSSKGVSTVIATVFLVLTVFVLATNVFLWTLTQNAIYNDAVRQRNQQDVDRLTENIIATNATFVVPSTGTVNVTADLVNSGSISAQIVTLWVYDTTKQKYNVTNLQASNINFNPGDRQHRSWAVQIPGAASTDSFSAWVVTARGNLILLQRETEIEPGTGGELQGGPFLLMYSASAFQYTSDYNPTSPQPAFEIDNDRTKIVFWIEFQNLASRNIQICKLSFFLVEVRELESRGVPGTTEYERYFQIVGPTSTSNALQAYTEYMQTIPSKQSATLKFGASTVGGTSFLSGEPLHGISRDDEWENLLWTFLVIFWRYEPTAEEPIPPTFGQTTAYAAIHSTD